MGVKPPKSKKPSSTNRDFKRQLKKVTFFLDRSLGGNLILEELRKVEMKVIPHSSRFRHNTEDIEWLQVVGEKKWIVLMCDKNIGRRLLELDTLLEARVRAFALSEGSLTAAEQVGILIGAIPQILRTLDENPFPFIAKIYSDSSVGIWKTEPKYQKGRRVKKRYRRLKKK